MAGTSLPAMANLFDADGAVSPAKAAAPAQDAHQRVDPVTAVALPAANRRRCWIVNRSDRAGSSKPPVRRFPDIRSTAETLSRAHLPRARTKVVTERSDYPSTYWCKRTFRIRQLGLTVPSVRPCRRYSTTSASMCQPFSPFARRPRCARTALFSRLTPMDCVVAHPCRIGTQLRPPGRMVAGNPAACGVQPDHNIESSQKPHRRDRTRHTHAAQDRVEGGKGRGGAIRAVAARTRVSELSVRGRVHAEEREESRQESGVEGTHDASAREHRGIACIHAIPHIRKF